MKILREILPIDSDIMIKSIHADSRDVRNHSIFFCIDGMTVDGHEFIDQAIRNGAKVIVHSKPVNQRDGILYYSTNDVIKAMIDCANRFYDYPSKQLKITGITGSVGKTSVATLVYQATRKFKNMGYVGTHLVEYGEYSKTYQYTTPEYIFLQETLSYMVQNGMDSACIEVSSHGLSLKRVEGIDFDIAVFTSLYPDHLDFHSTLENYENAKLSLFSSLKESAVAIVDVNEPFTEIIKQNTKAKIFTYGIDTHADICAKNLRLHATYSEFDLLYKQNAYHVHLPLIGEVNINHALAAISVLLNYDIDINDVVDAFNTCSQIKGHYEVVKNDHQLNIIVDEAYSPRHYKELFEFVQEIKGEGRVIAVFGCVGKREFNKREKIGALANKYCDYVILTEEDNRGEDIESICKTIQSKIDPIPSVIIENRELAIYQAIESANPGDTVLVLGKGENQFLIRDDYEVYYQGDYNVILSALKQIYSVANEDDYDDYEI